jgi:hypothetical protein
VYTVEVPELTVDNQIFSCKEVNPSVIQKVEDRLGNIPEEAKSSGKYFRKYVGNVLIGKKATLKQMLDKADASAENAASRFFDEIGLVYLAWPQAQTKPDGDTNRAVLNATNIKIIKIEQVQVNEKNKLIQGSQKEIAL